MPRKATVQQLIAFLDLPSFEDASLVVDPQLESFDIITYLDVLDPALFHCRIGSAIFTYRDQAWYTTANESPMHSSSP
jgi:hypothetical protein